jgi:hypothetical protein
MFFVGRAVRAPALARHRRVRGVTLTRLTDFVRCHFPVAIRTTRLAILGAALPEIVMPIRPIELAAQHAAALKI